ncbi:MAG: DUF503 domain-containing protein [Candidatus Omnitrophica bacterium]|nr:DUF503 domain-containing protein [Candidatus Omnitrophota bacterium]
MRVGALKIHMEIISSSSLKDKRAVLKGLKERIRRRFNVSISEIGNHDKWQRATLGISSISHDKQFIETMLNKIINYIEEEKSVLVLDINIEIL